MSFASSAVTYTSVYTNFDPSRAFWGADDEEISEGGIPRVIVYGYDGLPIQPVAPSSPDYIPGPEGPQTPPVPQDEDEHVFPAEEQPLLLVDSPTAESHGYITQQNGVTERKNRTLIEAARTMLADSLLRNGKAVKDKAKSKPKTRKVKVKVNSTN
ncbi:hypothetical protein Tco_0120942 [Tanacetum coccineum]